MIVKKFLFDLGNVFFDWSPERILLPILGSEDKLKFFINNISFPLLDTRCDAGVKIEVAVKDAIEKFPEFEKEIMEKFKDRVNNEEDLLKEIKKKTELIILNKSKE